MRQGLDYKPHKKGYTNSVGAPNHREAENANAVVIPQKEPSRTLVFRRLFSSVAQRSPCMIFLSGF